MTPQADWSRASNQELAAATHAGNDAAFEVLYQRCERTLYGIFTSRMPANSIADADELVVDTMAEVWKSLRNTVPDNFQSWLWTIARRTWADYLSTVKKTVLVEDHERFDQQDLKIVDDYRLAEMRASDKWFTRLLEDSISSMPEKYRPVLLANLRSGAAGQDLAKQLGISTQQANHWRHDALRLLYDAAAVTVMARGQEVKPCARFRRLLTASGWRGGPLGENLLRTLSKHVDQCASCNPMKRRLKKTLQLTPVFILVAVPTGLFALVQERRERRRTVKPVAAVESSDEKKDEDASGEKQQRKAYAAAGTGGGGVGLFIAAVLVVRALNSHTGHNPVHQQQQPAVASRSIDGEWLRGSSVLNLSGLYLGGDVYWIQVRDNLGSDSCSNRLTNPPGSLGKSPRQLTFSMTCKYSGHTKGRSSTITVQLVGTNTLSVTGDPLLAGTYR